MGKEFLVGEAVIAAVKIYDKLEHVNKMFKLITKDESELDEQRTYIYKKGVGYIDVDAIQYEKVDAKERTITPLTEEEFSEWWDNLHDDDIQDFICDELGCPFIDTLSVTRKYVKSPAKVKSKVSQLIRNLETVIFG